MAPISVLLGSFGVCTRGSGPSLTITSSISLALPDNWEANVSAADLFKEVEKGNLWIARAGTCSLEIIHDFNQEGTPALPQDTHRDVPRQLAAAVEHCPIWDNLGLKLERRGDQSSRGAGFPEQTTFSIQHPDLNSELLAPEGIPCAGFLALSCFLSVGPKSSGDRKRKRSTNKPGKEPAGCRAKRSRSGRDQIYLSQPSQRNKPISDTYSQASASQSSDFPSYSPGQLTTAPNFDGEIVARLINSAIYALVGVKKQMVGLKLVGETPSPSLIEIAPAVWSIPYLKARASRSSFLPTITSVLGGLVHAESPRLRHKVVTSLNIHTSQSPVDMDDISREIRRRLEAHLQGRLSFNPVSKAREPRSSGRSRNADETNQIDESHICDEYLEVRSGIDILSESRMMDEEGGDDALLNQQEMTQRSLQDVADDIDALQAEMAAMLGYHPDEFSPLNDVRASQNSYGDYQDDFIEGDSEFSNDPRDSLPGILAMSHLEGAWDQHAIQNEGYERSKFSEMQNVDNFELQNWEEGQFYGLDGSQGVKIADNGLELSDNNELAYTWSQADDLSFVANLNMSQPRDLGKFNMMEEFSHLDDTVDYDNLSQEVDGSNTSYRVFDAQL